MPSVLSGELPKWGINRAISILASVAKWSRNIHSKFQVCSYHSFKVISVLKPKFGVCTKCPLFSDPVTYKFLLRKSSIFTFAGLSPDLLLEISSPALENKCAAVTDVDGLRRYFVSSCCKWGYWIPCFFYHFRGSSWWGIFFSCR